MSKTSKTILIASIALVLIAVPLAFAAKERVAGDQAFDGPGHHRHGKHGFGGGMIFGKLAMLREELDLSEGQITQLTDIAQQARELNAPYREQMKGGLHEAAKVLLADPSATAQAQAILDQQFAAEKEMKKNVLLSVSKALNVLTPEQRAKLQEHLAKRAARF